MNGVQAAISFEEQYVNALASDGSGGVLLAWESVNTSPPGKVSVYGQKITSQGRIAPGWPLGGLLLTSAPGDQRNPKLVPDGNGGAIFGWDDRRTGPDNYQAYAQHITAAGTVAPGWPADGRLLSSVPGWQYFEEIVSDDLGGAIFVWADGRNTPPGGYNFDLYGVRLTGAGEVVDGWIPGGTPICRAPNPPDGFVSLAPDGQGGVFIVWSDLRTGPPPPPWTYVYTDVYAQHLTASGQIAPGWQEDGIPLCTANDGQFDPNAASDGSGGLLAVWYDNRAYKGDLYALRVLANGTRAPGWPADGQLVSDAPGFQVGQHIVPDGSGGAYIAYESLVNVYRVFAQHLTATGERFPGWPSGGIQLVSVSGTQDDAWIASDEGVGAFVVWKDSRTGEDDIYAQHLDPSGPSVEPTAVLLSLASAEVEPGLARLIWVAADSPGLTATVHRRTAGTEWLRLGTITADGTGRLVYEDHSVSAGRHAYRLGYVSDGAERFTPETWLEVPSAFRFALHGPRPNPAVGDLFVSFSLPTAQPATLELYDLSGRRLAAREVGSLGPGSQHVRIADRALLQAGVYWLRLTQGRERATARAVVMR